MRDVALKMHNSLIHTSVYLSGSRFLWMLYGRFARSTKLWPCDTRKLRGPKRERNINDEYRHKAMKYAKSKR